MAWVLDNFLYLHGGPSRELIQIQDLLHKCFRDVVEHSYRNGLRFAQWPACWRSIYPSWSMSLVWKVEGGQKSRADPCPGPAFDCWLCASQRILLYKRPLLIVPACLARQDAIPIFLKKPSLYLSLQRNRSFSHCYVCPHGNMAEIFSCSRISNRIRAHVLGDPAGGMLRGTCRYNGSTPSS